MKKSLATIFGEVLKELRKEAGTSQEKLAYECELDRSFISMLEKGLRTPYSRNFIQTIKSIKKNSL